MKIKKHQSGGVYNIVPYLYGNEQGATTAPASSTKSNTEEDMAKEYARVLGKEGLPVDVAVFSSRAKSILMSPDVGASSQYSKLLRLHELANEVRFNNELYKEAQTRIKDGMVGSDYALTSDGKFYVYDTKDNEVRTKTADQISESEGRFQPISNNELLNIRSRSNQFNSTMLMDVKNAVGMDEIMETVRNIVEKIGYQSRQGYVNQLGSSAQRGFEHLNDLMNGKDGLYEFKDKNSNAWQDIKSAVNYIYNSLNNNAKNTLQANADIHEMSNIDMILNTIGFNTTSERSIEALDENGRKKSTSGDGGGSTSKTPESWGHSVMMGTGFNSVLPINLGSGVQSSWPSKQYNMVVNKKNEQLTVTRMNQSYRNFQEWGLVDTMGKAYFGNIPLNDITLQGNDIIIDNLRGIHVVWMPVDGAGNINWDLFESMKEIQENIEKNRITDDSARAKIWNDNGFEYDPNTKMGKPTGGLTLKQFIAQDAYTSTKNQHIDNDLLNDSEFIKEDVDDRLDYLAAVYAQSPYYKDDAIELEHGWFGKNFRATIYIPMNNNENESLIAGGTGYTNKTSVSDVKAMQDLAMRGGGYDYGTRQFKPVNGTSSDDL